MTSLLTLPLAARPLLEECVRANAPREACGLLLGRRRRRVSRSWREVERVIVGANIAQDAERLFELGAPDLMRADTEARGAGLAIVGTWHSHPGGDARPSRDDLDGAWPEWSHVILAPDPGGGFAWRAWRASHEGFHEEDLRWRKPEEPTPEGRP